MQYPHAVERVAFVAPYGPDQRGQMESFVATAATKLQQTGDQAIIISGTNSTDGEVREPIWGKFRGVPTVRLPELSPVTRFYDGKQAKFESDSTRSKTKSAVGSILRDFGTTAVVAGGMHEVRISDLYDISDIAMQLRAALVVIPGSTFGPAEDSSTVEPAVFLHFSEREQRALFGDSPPENSWVLPVGTDSENWSITRYDRHHLSTRLGIGLHEPWLLSPTMPTTGSSHAHHIDLAAEMHLTLGRSTPLIVPEITNSTTNWIERKQLAQHARRRGVDLRFVSIPHGAMPFVMRHGNCTVLTPDPSVNLSATEASHARVPVVQTNNQQGTPRANDALLEEMTHLRSDNKRRKDKWADDHPKFAGRTATSLVHALHGSFHLYSQQGRRSGMPAKAKRTRTFDSEVSRLTNRHLVSQLATIEIPKRLPPTTASWDAMFLMANEADPLLLPALRDAHDNDIKPFLMCTGQTHKKALEIMFGKNTKYNAEVIDAHPYKHLGLLQPFTNIPGLSDSISTEVATMRNLSLVIAHMLEFENIILRDGDIYAISMPVVMWSASLMGKASNGRRQVLSTPIVWDDGDRSSINRLLHSSLGYATQVIGGTGHAGFHMNGVRPFTNKVNEDIDQSLLLSPPGAFARIGAGAQYQSHASHSPQTFARQEVAELATFGPLFHRTEGGALRPRQLLTTLSWERERQLRMLAHGQIIATAQEQETAGTSYPLTQHGWSRYLHPGVRTAMMTMADVDPRLMKRWAASIEPALHKWDSNISSLPRCSELAEVIDYLDHLAGRNTDNRLDQLSNNGSASTLVHRDRRAQLASGRHSTPLPLLGSAITRILGVPIDIVENALQERDFDDFPFARARARSYEELLEKSRQQLGTIALFASDVYTSFTETARPDDALHIEYGGVPLDYFRHSAVVARNALNTWSREDRRSL